MGQRGASIMPSWNTKIRTKSLDACEQPVWIRSQGKREGFSGGARYCPRLGMNIVKFILLSWPMGPWPDRGKSAMWTVLVLLLFPLTVHAEYLGNLSANEFDPNSIANQFGAGSPTRRTASRIEFGVYGSPYSNQSATNPYCDRCPTSLRPAGDTTEANSARTSTIPIR